jgi:hypothetical protein
MSSNNYGCECYGYDVGDNGDAGVWYYGIYDGDNDDDSVCMIQIQIQIQIQNVYYLWAQN